MLLSLEEARGNVGIYGGSFDPPHWGHLKTAGAAAEELQLDLLAFLPAAHPPHKKGRALTPFHARRQMLELCLPLEARFRLCLIEGEQSLPGTTLDTVLKLRELGYTEERVHLIWLLGSDALLELGTWRQPEKLLSCIEVAVLPRPGFPVEQAEKRFRRRVRILDTPLIELAAHDIRSHRIKLEEAVPQSVAEYIRAKGLYGYSSRQSE